MTKIILINGKKRSGKDYFANELRKELESRGESAEIMSFADPIKNIITTTFGISLEKLDEFKNNPELYPIETVCRFMPQEVILESTDYRTILQRFGTEAMKEYFGEAVWVNLLLERVAASESDFVLVPDFRFLCEDISPYTINIYNANTVNSGDTHRSENELNEFKFKYYVDNTDYSDLPDSVQYLADALIRSV